MQLLGDQIAETLASIGITKEQFSEWLGRPCACKERQEKLNSIDLWARHAARDTLSKTRDYFQRITGIES